MRLFGKDGPKPRRSASVRRAEAERGRRLIEHSPELVIVLDEQASVIAASRRAREAFTSLVEGEPVPPDVSRRIQREEPLRVDYDLDGRTETLVYLGSLEGGASYEELRAGFTAAVSHELRTPLARLLALLETALLPGSDEAGLLEQARREVAEMRELLDDVLLLGELEAGVARATPGPTPALPIFEEVVERLGAEAARAGVSLSCDGDAAISLPLTRRMVRLLGEKLAENAIAHAGPGTTFTLAIVAANDHVVVTARDDGVGVSEGSLARIFERFYRGDPSRTARGTGLGLAIVKHLVTAAGGTVEAEGVRGSGLTIRCRFPAG